MRHQETNIKPLPISIISDATHICLQSRIWYNPQRVHRRKVCIAKKNRAMHVLVQHGKPHRLDVLKTQKPHRESICEKHCGAVEFKKNVHPLADIVQVQMGSRACCMVVVTRTSSTLDNYNPNKWVKNPRQTMCQSLQQWKLINLLKSLRFTYSHPNTIL